MLIFVLFVLLGADPALAAKKTVKFCGWYQLEQLLDDGAAVGDDYFVEYDSGGDPYRFQRAYGAEIRVRRNSDNVMVHQDFAMWPSADTHWHCTLPLKLDDQESYRVSIVSRAVVGGLGVSGNLISVRNTNDQHLIGHRLLNFVPGAEEEVHFATGRFHVWNIAALTGFAMSRGDHGIHGEQLKVYAEACPSQLGSCLSGNTDIYIDVSVHHLSKQVVAHELGHWVSSMANGAQGQVVYYNEDPEECGTSYNGLSVEAGSHHFNSKEAQPGAAVEGFAHFYSAITYNDHGYTEDCWIGGGEWDWDLDRNPFNDERQFACDGPPGVYSPALSDADWMGEMCIPLGGNFIAVATPYDYTRFFWTMHYSTSLQGLMAIWALAEPHQWGATPTHPARRLEWAAWAYGGNLYAAAWHEAAEWHGVHR